MIKKKLNFLFYPFYFVVLIFSASLFSCKKCYDCETTVNKTFSGAYPPIPTSPTTENKEFCGTEKEKDEYVKNQTNITTSKLGV